LRLYIKDFDFSLKREELNDAATRANTERFLNAHASKAEHVIGNLETQRVKLDAAAADLRSGGGRAWQISPVTPPNTGGSLVPPYKRGSISVSLPPRHPTHCGPSINQFHGIL
jgi:hypothetical protein